MAEVKSKHDECTVSEYQYHTPSREERRFLYFNHLSKEFLEQMIPHLKCSKMHLFQALFVDFELQQLAISKPVEVGKSYILQKKAQLPIV